MKFLLANARISQNEIARHLGLSPSMTSLVLNGRRPARGALVAELAYIFAVAPNDLITEAA